VGNWRTVNIVGTMTAEHAGTLLDLLNYGDYHGGDQERYRRVWGSPCACLAFSLSRPGLCGLGGWPAEHVSRCGNLAERGFDVEDVAAALRALVHVAPSMLLKVHCGGEYESTECVATVSVGEGLVVVGRPERETVDTPSDEQVLVNLYQNLHG
jgi:hypothetical protein